MLCREQCSFSIWQIFISLVINFGLALVFFKLPKAKFAVFNLLSVLSKEKMNKLVSNYFTKVLEILHVSIMTRQLLPLEQDYNLTQGVLETPGGRICDPENPCLHRHNPEHLDEVLGRPLASSEYIQCDTKFHL